MIITFTVKLIFFKIKNAEGVGAGELTHLPGYIREPGHMEAFKESKVFLVGPDPPELRGCRGERIIDSVHHDTLGLPGGVHEDRVRGHAQGEDYAPFNDPLPLQSPALFFFLNGPFFLSSSFSIYYFRITQQKSH